MDNSTTKIVEADDKGKEASQFCFSLPNVLRHILEQLPTKDLIELSLVNKLWNFEAKSVMKKRGNVTAKILHGEYIDVCLYQISEFASVLKEMSVIPFSGIHLYISHNFVSCPNINGPTDSSHKPILDLIAWKRFSVHQMDHWGCCPNCPALLLVKQIFMGCCGSLEHLTVKLRSVDFLRPILKERTLPCLKYLTLQKASYYSEGFDYTKGFVKAMVSRAPNLQELRVDCKIDLTGNVLEGSSAVLVPTFYFRPLFHPICHQLIGSIRLEEANLCINSTQVRPGVLSEAIPMLLRATHTTLKELSMDLFFALPLMCYGICLENVTRLKLHANFYSVEEIEPSVLEIAKGFDFTRVFPRLKKVMIFDDDNHDYQLSFEVVRSFVEQANAMLNRASPERAINIKVLGFVLVRAMEDSTRSLLAQMFPEVKTVVTEDQDKGASFTELREHFLCLEEVVDSLDRAQHQQLVGACW